MDGYVHFSNTACHRELDRSRARRLDVVADGQADQPKRGLAVNEWTHIDSTNRLITHRTQGKSAFFVSLAATRHALLRFVVLVRSRFGFCPDPAPFAAARCVPSRHATAQIFCEKFFGQALSPRRKLENCPFTAFGLHKRRLRGCLSHILRITGRSFHARLP